MEPIRLLGSSDALSVDHSGSMSKTARKKLRRKERKKALEDIACLNNMSLNMMNTVSDQGDACSQKKADGINEEAKLKNDTTGQRKMEKGKAALARPETCKTEMAETSANKNCSSKVHCKENKATTVNGENEHCTRSKTGVTNGDTRHIKNGHSKSGKKDNGCENRNMVADQAGCNPGKGNSGGNKGDGKGKQGCERKKENLVKTRTSQASENAKSTVKNEMQKSQEMGKKGKKDKNSSKLSEHVSFIHEKTANGENMKMKPNGKQLSSDCMSGVVNGKASIAEIDKQFNPNNGENSKQFKPNGKQFSSGSNFEASSAKSKPSATADTVRAALKLPSSLAVSGLNVNSEPGTSAINSGSLVPGSCIGDDQESEATTKRKKKKKRVKKSSSTLSDGKIDIGRTNLCSEYLKNALVSQYTKKSSATTGIRKASAIFDISADDTLLELDGLTSHLTQEQMEPQAIKKMMLLKQRKKLSLEKVKLQTETQQQTENIVEFEQMENGIEVNDGEIHQNNCELNNALETQKHHNDFEVNDDSESQKNHIDNGDDGLETQQMANALENDFRGTVGSSEQHLETDSGSSSEPNQGNGINGAMFKAEGSAKARAESEAVESETITVDSSDGMEVIAEDEPVSCTAARAEVSLPLFEAILDADEVVNTNVDSGDASDENLDSNKDKENIDSDEAIPDLDNVDDANLNSDDVGEENLDSDDVGEGNLDSDDVDEGNLESDEAVLDSDDVDDVIIVEDEDMDRNEEEVVEEEGLIENGIEVNGDTDNLVSQQEEESVFQIGNEINNDVDRNGEEGLEDENLFENGIEVNGDTRNDVGHKEDEHGFDNDVEVNKDTNSEVSQVEDEFVIENGKEREDQDFNNSEHDAVDESISENDLSNIAEHNFNGKFDNNSDDHDSLAENGNGTTEYHSQANVVLNGNKSVTGIDKVWEQNHFPTSFTSQVQQHSEVQQRSEHHNVQTTNGIVNNGNHEVSSVYDGIAENGIYAVSNGCHQTRSTYSGEEQLEDIRNGNHPNSLVNLGQKSSHHDGIDDGCYEVNCDAVLDDSKDLLVDSSDCIIVEHTHGKDSVVHEVVTSFNGISSVGHDIDNSLNGNSLIDHPVDNSNGINGNSSIDHAIDNSFKDVENSFNNTDCDTSKVPNTVNENINPNSEDIVAKCGSSSNSTNAFDAFDGANAASTTSDNHAAHMHSDIVTQSPACLADRLKLKLRKKSTRNVLETFTNGKFAS